MKKFQKHFQNWRQSVDWCPHLFRKHASPCKSAGFWGKKTQEHLDRSIRVSVMDSSLRACQVTCWSNCHVHLFQNKEHIFPTPCLSSAAEAAADGTGWKRENCHFELHLTDSTGWTQQLPTRANQPQTPRTVCWVCSSPNFQGITDCKCFCSSGGWRNEGSP